MKRSCQLQCALVSVALLLCVVKGFAQYNEKYRDQFHFSPNSGWIGDPDGLIKWKGTYHLYWWGHATSTDLVHWNDQPYPIVGDPGNYGINTGSAVVDKNNVAGFGTNAVIGFHTLTAGPVQGVGISSSVDSGFRYNLYGSNPVLGFLTDDNFRDPQVFWHPATNKWVLAIAKGHERKISFYTSSDLKSWTWRSDFGPSGGYSYDNWETPDLFPLPVDGNPANTKWVLTVGAFPTPGGGGDTVREVYHVGSFNGTAFTSDNPGTEFRLDHGRDFYAA
ncbi:MAG: glycoside hydrolase family 32 protein, partial [Chitinophagaceae bacterium]|nr:glycoside hydrolase family 32 protein [Chitinophagaceae bacterium]